MAFHRAGGSFGGSPAKPPASPTQSEAGEQPVEVGLVLHRAAGGFGDDRSATPLDGGTDQVDERLVVDLPGPEAGVPVRAGVEGVAAVVGVHEVDPTSE